MKFGICSLFLLMLLGCQNDPSSSAPDGGLDETIDTQSDGNTDADTDGDTDTDADGDTDSDADGDTDSDADGDTDSDADGDTDSDADGDTDTDADADADGDTDTDADTDTDTDTDSDSNETCQAPAACSPHCRSIGGTVMDGSCETGFKCCLLPDTDGETANDSAGEDSDTTPEDTDEPDDSTDIPTEPLTVFIMGDSTVSEYADTSSTTDQAGWGQMFHEYYNDNVTVDNRAIGGRTALWFYMEGGVDGVINDLSPGDYCLIQFGTNDSHTTATFEIDGVTYPRYADPDTDFTDHLKTYYLDPIRAAGGIPVLVTPPPRNSAYCTGGNSLAGYAEAMRKLGAAEDVAVVDLNQKTVDHLIDICPSPTPEDFFFIKADGSVDGTHFQENGARILAGFVADGIEEADLSLDAYREGKETGGDTGDTGDTEDTTSPITVWIAGDSTVSNGGSCPIGWGQTFGALFNDTVTVDNRAIAGRSIRKWMYQVTSEMGSDNECKVLTDANGEWLKQSHWAYVLDNMKTGDYLLIQFGINDSSSTCDRHVGIAEYQRELGVMADEAMARGGKAIFLTPLSMIRCEGSNAAYHTRGEFETATVDAGEEYNTPVIQLTELSADLYNEKGFCPLPDGYSDINASTPGDVGAFFCEDHTHLDTPGAEAISQVIADAMAEQNIGLAARLK